MGDEWREADQLQGGDQGNVLVVEQPMLGLHALDGLVDEIVVMNQNWFGINGEAVAVLVLQGLGDLGRGLQGGHLQAADRGLHRGHDELLRHVVGRGPEVIDGGAVFGSLADTAQNRAPGLQLTILEFMISHKTKERRGSSFPK